MRASARSARAACTHLPSPAPPTSTHLLHHAVVGDEGHPLLRLQARVPAAAQHNLALCSAAHHTWVAQRAGSEEGGREGGCGAFGACALARSTARPPDCPLPPPPPPAAAPHGRAPATLGPAHPRAAAWWGARRGRGRRPPPQQTPPARPAQQSCPPPARCGRGTQHSIDCLLRTCRHPGAPTQRKLPSSAAARQGGSQAALRSPGATPRRRSPPRSPPGGSAGGEGGSAAGTGSCWACAAWRRRCLPPSGPRPDQRLQVCPPPHGATPAHRPRAPAAPHLRQQLRLPRRPAAHPISRPARHPPHDPPSQPHTRACASSSACRASYAPASCCRRCADAFIGLLRNLRPSLRVSSSWYRACAR